MTNELWRLQDQQAAKDLQAAPSRPAGSSGFFYEAMEGGKTPLPVRLLKRADSPYGSPAYIRSAINSPIDLIRGLERGERQWLAMADGTIFHMSEQPLQDTTGTLIFLLHAGL